ncbi:Protein CBG00478 [Caenorhabditis briggsae]|uniref:Protein CBG00478 n=1 Tax=Caenorhabditis briggsae TaxID=6238 RepID=A8WMR4_CAEBR|nr:Protein CBG00478 [Caenorhabditis briggsae]CAP21769.2 Protein CBG00478 [Caenorhabditis briggsae]
MNTEFKNIIGIVVGQESYDRFFVWCKDSKRHVILQMNPEKPIKMGDWVNLKFTSSEFQKFKESQVSSYEIISEIYETEVQGNRVLVKLEQYLMSNQQELKHHFFGKIHNAHNICFPSGAYYLAIKSRDDIWIIEHLTTVIPKTKNSKTIGIVLAILGTNQFSVWYKGSKKYFDVFLKSENLEMPNIGTWLSMDLYLNPDSNIFECWSFTVIPTPIHPTFFTEKNQLCLKLEIWIPKDSVNIFHPFVGEIANTLGAVITSGRYSTIVQKTKIGAKFAWFLKERELVSVHEKCVKAPLEMYQFSPVTQNHDDLVLALLNLAPPISHNQQTPCLVPIQPTMAPQPVARRNFQTPARPSNLQRKTQALGSQSEASISVRSSNFWKISENFFQTIGRPTIRQRSLSRSTNEVNTENAPRHRKDANALKCVKALENVLKNFQFFCAFLDAFSVLLRISGALAHFQCHRFFQLRSLSPPNQPQQQPVTQPDDLIALLTKLKSFPNNQNNQHPVHQEPIQPTVRRSLIRNEERGRAKSKRRSISRPKTHEITGIVVAEDAKNFFVWCRERLPGQNITIPKTPNSASLSLTSWIEFTVTSEQMSRFFLNEMPDNGIYPRFQKDQFRIVSTKFPTYLNPQDKSISIEINIWLRQSWEIQNIEHEILGTIINENFVFDKSGWYLLIIRNQFKNGENAESVWYLEECRLVSTTHKYSLLQAKTRVLGSQSDNSLSTIERQTQRQRSSSRPRNEAPPTPAPRSSVEEKVTKIESEAIITSILIDNGKESIFLWIFELGQTGILYLNVAAEKLNLEPGKVFKSTFVNWNGKWSSRGPVAGCKDLYATRINNSDQIEVLVSGEVLEEPNDEHCNCPWIPHPHFGDILDYHCKIKNHAGFQYTFWIRRQKLGGNYHWVVREQVNC